MNAPDQAPDRNGADDLRQRRAEIAQALQETDAACDDQALKSALGDGSARRALDRFMARRAELSAQATALDRAIAGADADVSRAAQARQCDERAETAAACRDLLQQRLGMAERIDSLLRALLTQVEIFSDLGNQVERCQQMLGRPVPILSPLAPEAMGGRLAEFMAGLGFGIWLPLMRPETRPAIQVLRDAEEIAQQSFAQQNFTCPAEEVAA